jgi:hypothetical protein
MIKPNRKLKVGALVEEPQKDFKVNEEPFTCTEEMHKKKKKRIHSEKHETVEPESKEPFQSLAISDKIKQALNPMGFTMMTEIQSNSIPECLAENFFKINETDFGKAFGRTTVLLSNSVIKKKRSHLNLSCVDNKEEEEHYFTFPGHFEQSVEHSVVSFLKAIKQQVTHQKPEMDEIIQDIKTYCELIFDEDLNTDRKNNLEYQQQKYSACIKKLLPIDTCMSDSPSLITDFLDLLGDETQNLYTSMISSLHQSNRCQNSWISCAIGASGTGKTSIGYRLGSFEANNSAYNPFVAIVMRIGKLHRGEAKLSDPWSLLETLFNLVVQCIPEEDIPRSLQTQLARFNSKLIQLLIASYLQVTLMVLEWCHSGKWTKDKTVKQKMVLLFHRNETSNRLVKGIFQIFICNSFAGEPENSQGLKSITNSMDSFLIDTFEGIKNAMFNKHLLLPLLVYDEVQMLATKCTIYGRQQSSDRDFEGGPDRNLFYTVSCKIVEVFKNYAISAYVTGTSFPHDLLIEDFSSVHRNSVQFISPKFMFDLVAIKKMLTDYFKFSFTFGSKKSTINKLLGDFAGRPFIFVNNVFSSIFDDLVSNKNSLILSDPTEFIKKLSECRIKVGKVFTNRLEELFTTEGPRSKAVLNKEESARFVLIPILLEMLLSDDTTIRFLKNDTHLQPLMKAISTGIVPISLEQCHDGNKIISVNLKEAEPIVYEAVESYFDLQMATDISSAVKRSFGDYLVTVTYNAAHAYELAFAFALTLKVRYEKHLLLSDLLALFFDGPWSMFPTKLLHGWKCKTSRVVNLRNGDRDTTCQLNRLVGRIENGKQHYRDDIILVGLDERMGMNLAFVVTSGDSESEIQYRLVVIQAKYQEQGTLSDLLVNLHPATQFLTYDERTAILTKVRPVKRSRGATFGHSKWRNYKSFMESHPTLSEGWIRLGLTARQIDARVFKEVNKLNEDKKLCNSSPIVLLSLKREFPDLLHVEASREKINKMKKSDRPFCKEIKFNEAEKYLRDTIIKEHEILLDLPPVR